MTLQQTKAAHGGDQLTIYILCGIIAYLITSSIIQYKLNHNQIQIINRLNDTIQKLLNREPVTYKEVGQEKPKADTDRPIAWAGAIADRDEL